MKGEIPVKERPILFNAEMVRAVLAGKKTQTRRVCRAVPVEGTFDGYGPDAMAAVVRTHCPYGIPGDRLWVRETHYRWTGCGDAPQHWVRKHPWDSYHARGYVGDADNDKMHENGSSSVKVPSIHMPRWASRINLEVVDVRVERVQAITTDDILAEGVRIPAAPDGTMLLDLLSDWWKHLPDGKKVKDCTTEEILHAHWWNLWDSINAKRGFGKDVNPWVWVVKFKAVNA